MKTVGCSIAIRNAGPAMDFVQKANALFDRKWRAYLDHNINRIPGTFDYE